MERRESGDGVTQRYDDISNSKFTFSYAIDPHATRKIHLKPMRNANILVSTARCQIQESEDKMIEAQLPNVSVITTPLSSLSINLIPSSFLNPEVSGPDTACCILLSPRPRSICFRL